MKFLPPLSNCVGLILVGILVGYFAKSGPIALMILSGVAFLYATVIGILHFHD